MSFAVKVVEFGIDPMEGDIEEYSRKFDDPVEAIEYYNGLIQDNLDTIEELDEAGFPWHEHSLAYPYVELFADGEKIDEFNASIYRETSRTGMIGFATNVQLA